jgi:hypothetical protein
VGETLVASATGWLAVGEGCTTVLVFCVIAGETSGVDGDGLAGWQALVDTNVISKTNRINRLSLIYHLADLVKTREHLPYFADNAL